MLMPSIFGENLIDDFFGFDYPHRPHQTAQNQNLMRTDVKEHADGYEVDIDLPGFKKEDIHMELKDGYLTVGAATSSKKDEKSEEGKYIRRERFTGNVMRSFYVGKDVKEEDIHPKYENGILSFTVPKKDAKKAVEEKNHYITIE